MKPKNFKFKRVLQTFFLALVVLAEAQDNETTQLTSTIPTSATGPTINRAIEIIVLYEPSYPSFINAFVQLIADIRTLYSDIEINYRQVMFDRNNVSKIQNEFCRYGQKGISIFIDGSYTGFNQLREILNDNLIPYYNFDYSIQPYALMMETYVKARMATDVVLVLQDEQDADEALYYFIMKSTVRIILMDQLAPNAVKRLRTLRPVPNYYAIIADTENMERLLKIALDGGLLHLPERWNLMYTDYEAYNSKINNIYPEMSKLLPNGVACCNPNEYETEKCSCPTQRTLKFEALKKFLHLIVNVFVANDFPIYRLSCKRNISSGRSHKLLNSINEAIEKEPLIYLDNVQKVRQNISFSVYTNSESNPSVTEYAAIVDINGARPVDNHSIKAAKRFLRIGITDGIPWTFPKQDPITKEIIRDEKGEIIWEGYCIDFINKLAEHLFFEYELVLPEHGKFGSMQKDGYFDGLIGDLAAGKTDLIVAALKMTAEREEQIDYVAPYFEQTGILIVMKKPIPDTSLFKFMTVLRLEVWLSIFGALSVTAIVIWILERISPYSARNWKYEEHCRQFTLRESFWFTLTSFTPQGGGEAPKALSGRVIVAAYWLFVVLMLATFTANLAAFLTVERMQTPVQSLDQLARQSRINYTVVNGSDTHVHFKNLKLAENSLYLLWRNLALSSTSNVAQYRVWDFPIKEQYDFILKYIESSGPVPNASEGFRIVNERESNDFAFIHDAAEIKYEMARNCNFSAVGDTFAEQPYALAVQQGSHLQDELSRVLLELQKQRFFEDLTAKYWNTSVKGECIHNDDSEGITLESLGGVFIATVAGLVIAMITLVGEVYYYKKKAEQENKKKDDGLKVVPFTLEIPKYENLEYSEKVLKHSSTVLLSDNFTPSNKKKRRLSFISVNPRD